jgi:hypothetical protein
VLFRSPEAVNPELAALSAKYDAELATLKQRLEAATAKPESTEQKVPDEYSMFFDKELYDPAKKVYGGVAITEESTPLEVAEWMEQRDAYYKAIASVNSYNENLRTYSEAQRIAREHFKTTHPDVDPMVLQKHFEDKPMTYEDAYTLKQIREAGGSEAYVKKASEALVAKAREDAIKAISATPPANPPLSNVDGRGMPLVTTVKLPENMKDYYNMTPAQRELAEQEVDKMYQKTEIYSR